VFAVGPKKIPELGQGLAEGIRGFQKGRKVGSEPDSQDKTK